MEFWVLVRWKLVHLYPLLNEADVDASKKSAYDDEVEETVTETSAQSGYASIDTTGSVQYYYYDEEGEEGSTEQNQAEPSRIKQN